MAFLKAGQSGVIIDENGNKIVDENGNGFSIGSGKFILKANRKILKAGGGGDTVDIGGRAYRTVTIGTQTWLAENLDYSFDGLNVISSGSSSSGAVAYYKDANFRTKYGLLYNNAAAILLESNKETLLPSGWRVPTRADFENLFNAIGGISQARYKLISHEWSGLDTDEYGFGMLPAGQYDGGLWYEGSRGYLFMNTTGGSYGYYLLAEFRIDSTSFNSSAPSRYCSSIRLVKDS